MEKTLITWEQLKAEVFEGADISSTEGYSPITWPEEDFDDNSPDWERTWTLMVSNDADPAEPHHMIMLIGSSRLGALHFPIPQQPEKVE